LTEAARVRFGTARVNSEVTTRLLRSFIAILPSSAILVLSKESQLAGRV
jgi:hypothetical protein